MPRLSRLYLDYACYHIMCRGNQKRNVFKEEVDCSRYLGVLNKALKKFDVKLYAYCLMPNHVHLMVDPKIGKDISDLMRWVNRGYTAYYNSKYDTVGHLWQGRFLSKPIIRDTYLFHCAAYIEANPVRAKLVNDLASYDWSSYRERCLLQSRKMLDEIIPDFSISKGGSIGL